MTGDLNATFGHRPITKAAHHPCKPIRSPSTVIPSAAEGSLLHCRHMHTCTLTQTTPWCFPLSPFPHPRFTGLQKRSLHFGRDDRWKTGNLTQSFTPLRGSILRLWRAPSLNHHALRHHCERKRISAIIRVETTT